MGYTEEQKQIMKEWFDFTGWEFMAPNDGETFSDAVRKNWRWLENHTNDAVHIGAEYVSREWLSDAVNA